MQPGFYNKTLATLSQDGRNFVLLEALYFLDYDGTWYACPEGSESDGVSTPAVVWMTDPPFGKERWFTGILHDCSPKYRCTLLVWKGNHWAVVTDMSLMQCNALLKRALVSQGTSQEKADEYFVVLNLAGGAASVNDLAGPIEKLHTPPPPPNSVEFRN